MKEEIKKGDWFKIESRRDAASCKMTPNKPYKCLRVSVEGHNTKVFFTDDEGNDIRTITSINKLYDVSPVTYPAYSNADSDLVVAQRGLAMYKEKQEIKEEENDLVARSLAKLKIELIKRTK
jgi:hypothetical protein